VLKEEKPTAFRVVKVHINMETNYFISNGEIGGSGGETRTPDLGVKNPTL
jgi:hypothetical protein